jgi:hypothetical protein
MTEEDERHGQLTQPFNRWIARSLRASPQPQSFQPLHALEIPATFLTAPLQTECSDQIAKAMSDAGRHHSEASPLIGREQDLLVLLNIHHIRVCLLYNRQAGLTATRWLPVNSGGPVFVGSHSRARRSVFVWIQLVGRLVAEETHGSIRPVRSAHLTPRPSRGHQVCLRCAPMRSNRLEDDPTGCCDFLGRQTVGHQFRAVTSRVVRHVLGGGFRNFTTSPIWRLSSIVGRSSLTIGLA